jgi:hypothetical protein
MAGIQGISFDEAGVIAGLHTAMQVGLPPEEEDQPTFYWPTIMVTDDAKDSAESVPFDPASRPTRPAVNHVRVPCAVEYFDGSGKVISFGVIQASRVVLTLLQPEYDQVNDSQLGMFQYVVIGADRYFYAKERPPLGLVTLGIHQIECTAEDDT